MATKTAKEAQEQAKSAGLELAKVQDKYAALLSQKQIDDQSYTQLMGQQL